ncbi:hypothetical protein R1flu_007320 [Riccia fluitans]|uniref:Uncharacterized protein n=1 Tax=Riccia fluitans TaxID=41844 RepID=A0ABD1YZ35_9MARC
MANSNLRPISAACNLLIGADKSKDEAERDVKQREWIWEFFLRNHGKGRLLTELMTAVPFPNDNLYLKRLLLLRSLSLQLELRLFNEVTLDILKALEETSRRSEGSRAGNAVQSVKRRRVFCKENVETKILTPEATVAKRRLPESLVGRKPSEVGIVEEDSTHQDQKVNGSLDGNIASSVFEGDRNEISVARCEGSLWELQLALMVELSVKHLRGVSVSRKDFEAALMTYWGDLIMDTEEPGAECLNTGGKREEIRKELWKVHDNLDLLEEITCKYTEERVGTMLAYFLENAWAETEESFLEKVSKDVSNGSYDPPNPDVHRRAVRGAKGEDGAGMRRRDASLDRLFVRSSRGKVSRSRDKKHKAFGVLQIEAREESQERISPQNLTISGEIGTSIEALRMCKLNGIEPRLAEKASLPASDTSQGFGNKDAGISGSKEPDAAEAEDEGFNHEETGRSQPCGRVEAWQEDRNGAADVDGRANENITIDRNEELLNVSTSPSSPNTRGAVHSSPGGPYKSEGSRGNQEISEKPCYRAKFADKKIVDLEQGVVEIVDLSSPSPQPLDHIQGRLSPPPWVGSTYKSRKNLTGEFVRTQPVRGTEVDTGNPRAERSGGAEKPVEISDPPVETLRKEGNDLQTQPSADIQISSPKIRERGAASRKFNQRNSTARTLEWEEEDDISESRGTPQGSKRVTAERTSPGIASRRTSSSQTRPQRRKPRKWSRVETETLKNEVFKYGKGRWKLILANNVVVFDGRTEVDLKDKWRNLERFEGLSIPEG